MIAGLFKNRYYPKQTFSQPTQSQEGKCSFNDVPNIFFVSERIVLNQVKNIVMELTTFHSILYPNY
jgi:hypothetical protein